MDGNIFRDYIRQHQNVVDQTEKLRAIEGQLPKEGTFYVEVPAHVANTHFRVETPTYKVEILEGTVHYSRIEVL